MPQTRNPYHFTNFFFIFMTEMYTPSYIALHKSGELVRRAGELESLLSSCSLCPWDCGIDRTRNEIAVCHSGALPIVSSYCLHFGEEPALGGTKGVGNIFFGNCNLRCVYCQNHEISQNWRAEQVHEVSIGDLARMMLELQELGAHAIGFVSPTHFVPQIVRAVGMAAERGLTLPLIYNTNSYDSVGILRLLDGIIDIYLPDIKYADDDSAYQFSKIKEYVPVSRAALQEMHRQVGSSLMTDEEGIVRRGMIIRHLVLPNDIARSEESLSWIAENLGTGVTLSIMAQYFPAHRADRSELLNRRIRESEYNRVLRVIDSLGFTNGWIQDFDSHDYYRRDFSDRVHPFNGVQSIVAEGGTGYGTHDSNSGEV